MDKSIASIAVVFVIVGALFFFYERSKVSSKEIPVLAVLAALAALGRVPFAVIPSVQPTTFIVMISGFVFGPVSGFVVGAVAAVVSNMFLGQGPWTIWQMFAWALCGASTGLLPRIWPGITLRLLTVAAFIWGFAFGWIMNFWYWISFVFPLTIESWIATNVASFWFDILHGAGNVVFMTVFGPSFVRILKHFRRKLVVTYE